MNNTNNSPEENINVSKSNSSDKTFFNHRAVNKLSEIPKDHRLKARLRSHILRKGYTEPKFKDLLNISRQYWFILSYGLQPTPIHLKVKIGELLDCDSAVLFEEVQDGTN